ncbi:unnamed protein product [Peronospora belbahrii]|uniref:Nucleoplasmin-like domain-containing protein n=1 Tax=Peronospora belbahrii TaxID=622444 RepID=A0AAU9L6R8_9STRA|nr:unnamed protein product [Peronospora belbahrii]
MVAFWGCDVTETKDVVVDVSNGIVLNVCNATCGALNTDDQVVLGLETKQVDGKVWKGAVAHLGGKQPLQVKLDLVFDHTVKFYLSKGSGVVNLTGYFQPVPPMDLFEEEEEKKTCHVEMIPTKTSKKRAREQKTITEKNWDEDSSSSSDLENKVPEMKMKAAVTTPSAKHQEEQNEKKAAAEGFGATSLNHTTSAATLQKKKRKKKHKKQAVNGKAE